MGPDWWSDAWIACREHYDQASNGGAGPSWDELTMDQQTEAVRDHLRMIADMQRDIEEELNG